MSEQPVAERIEEIRRVYAARRDRAIAERDALSRRARIISHSRLAAFAAFGAGVGWAIWGSSGPRALWALLGFLALLGFIVLVLVHDRVLNRLTRAELLIALNAQGLSRLDRDWNALPLPSAPDPGGVPHFTGDLDLLGRGSLFHLLGTACTPPGKRTLVDWLLRPAAVSVIRERQEAAAELARLLDWRQDLQVRGQHMADLPPDPERLLAWAEGPPSLASRWLLVWPPRVLALCTVVLLALSAAHVMSHPVWLILALFNLALGALAGRQLHVAASQLSAREREFGHYASLFQQLSSARLETPLLRRLQQELATGELSAVRELRQLDRVLSLADVRRAGLLHLPLQGLLLWDYHVLFLLDRWRLRAGRELRRWLGLLGEVEALSALAGLRHDHPDWVFPTLRQEAPPRVEATALGHPLLPPRTCVPNDVVLGPAGTLLLVTGSNMSGKSTLLRAIGANLILAQAGGPVCARALTLPPITLGTSFRVQDSLQEGVSYFMAELRRLKEIVDLAARCQAEGERTLVFLLDEILLGTNIIERQIAVRRVLAHLLQREAMGAISTHDLTLANAEGIAPACRPVYFRETLEERPGGLQMSFDYTLREGVAPTANALKLLQLVGLEVGDG